MSTSSMRQRRNVIAATDASSPVSTRQQQPRVLVVGGGLAGAAVAKFMADQKQEDDGVTPLYQVQLCEAYPHPESSSNNMDESKSSTNRFVISLGRKGQEGIRKAAGIDAATDIIPGSVYSDEVARMPSGKVLERGKSSLMIPRQRLASHLLQAAQVSGVTVHFEHALVDIDFDQRVARFEIGSKKKKKLDDINHQQANNPLAAGEVEIKTKEIAYDLLIGADGARSRVRTLLDQAAAGDFKILKIEEDTMEYQVCVLPHYKPEFENISPKTMLAWNDPKQNAVCLCYPLAADSSPTCPSNTAAAVGRMFVPIFPQGKLGEFQKQYTNSSSQQGEKQQQQQQGYTEALADLLPNVPESTRQEIAVELSKGKQANGGLCVWTSSLGSPTLGVALVGDSGHAMWPSLGQGANCACETAGVFCDIVRGHCPVTTTSSSSSVRQWSADIVQDFNAQRHADATAAVDLTYGGMGDRKSRGLVNAPLAFKLQLAGMMLLHVLTCKLVPKPALLRLMSAEDNVPYVTAKNMHFYYERRICLAAFVGVPAMAAMVVFHFRQ